MEECRSLSPREATLDCTGVAGPVVHLSDVYGGPVGRNGGEPVTSQR